MCSVYLQKEKGMLPLGKLEIFSLEMVVCVCVSKADLFGCSSGL